jgi:D-glycero-alpha-D-manno-heptose-7-phosphate kinase
LIITRTPFRISFVGGGSDLESFYSRQKGAVISTSINKYMYISSHKFFEVDKIRVKYSKTETVNKAEELQHPILRTVLKKFNVTGGLEVSSIADVPSGTGLGSSSAFTVGVLHNLHLIKKNPVHKEHLAAEACHVEIDLLKEPIGKQDQYATAMGGMNLIEFETNGNVVVTPVNPGIEILSTIESNLLMFYTGDQRSASNILAEQNKNTAQNDKFNSLKSMVALVYDTVQAVNSGNLNDFGKVLHENWILKKQLASGISNPLIDEAYDTAMKNGALGGKLLGAGGGGFLLFYCPLNLQQKLITSLKPLRQFDFKFDQDGSKLIHFSDE